MHSVTSNAVFNNFLTKHKMAKTIRNDIDAILTLSEGFYCCYLITLSRDKLDQSGIGILTWDYNDSIKTTWLKSVTFYTVTLTKISTLQSRLEISNTDNVILSLIDLNGRGRLTLS